MIEDKLLIWKFKAGDSDALRRIYVKYKDFMLKLAVSLINDVNSAEDAVHDVFVKFAQSADSVKLKGNLKSFLATCVANRIRNVKRDRSRHEIVGLDEAQNAASGLYRPEEWLILSENMRLLSEALAKVPYNEREVISLYTQGDLNFRQIAQLQDTSINTIQGRYRNGINKLRILLNSEVKHETCR